MRGVCAVVLLVLVGCGKSSNDTVRVATYPTFESFPYYLGHELGYFHEEGLQISTEEFNNGTKIMEALVGGSSDVSTDGLTFATVMAAQGRQLQNFFNTYEASPFLLVVGPGKAANRIRHVADLKSAIVGVGSFGGLHHRMLAYYLRRAGLSEADIQLTAIGATGTAVAAVEHGKVDAAMMSGSGFARLTRRAPGSRVLVDPRSREKSKELFEVAAYPGGPGLLATSRWISKNPATARRLVRAMSRTLGWVHAHRPEEVLARIPAKLRTAEAALDLEDLRMIIGMLSKDGRMPAGGPEAVQRVLAASLESAKSIDLGGTWTNEFFEVAK